MFRPAALALPRRRRPARPLLQRLLALMALQRHRRRLARLGAHMLADIGISQDEARAEAARPVWDAPAHWMR